MNTHSVNGSNPQEQEDSGEKEFKSNRLGCLPGFFGVHLGLFHFKRFFEEISLHPSFLILSDMNPIKRSRFRWNMWPAGAQLVCLEETSSKLVKTWGQHRINSVFLHQQPCTRAYELMKWQSAPVVTASAQS
jgi:hypothetical protein